MIHFIYCPILGLRYWIIEKPLITFSKKHKKWKKNLQSEH